MSDQPTQQHRDEAHALERRQSVDKWACDLTSVRAEIACQGLDGGDHSETCRMFSRFLDRWVSHRDTRLLAEGRAAGIEAAAQLVERQMAEWAYVAPGRNNARDVALQVRALATLPPVGTGSEYGRGLRDGLLALYTKHCECRPLRADRSTYGHSHDCDTGITDAIEVVLAELPTDAPKGTTK